MIAAAAARILRDDDYPWRRMAIEELNDDPTKQDQKLSEMKQRLETFQEKHPKFRPQADDEFLLAFLRTRKFNVKKAFDAFLKYHTVRQPNPEMLVPRGKGPCDYLHILHKKIVTIVPQRNPLDGTVVGIVSLRNFNFEVEDVSHIINIIYYFFRIVVRTKSFQTLGIRLIIDIGGVSMSFFTTLLRRFYNLKALIIAQGCFPVRIKSVHLMNEYYGMVKRVYSLVWPFLSTKMRKRVFLHGTSFSELHNHVSRDILPRELGGTQETIDCSQLTKLLLETHDEAVEEVFCCLDS